jgi:hypothetical protein
MELKSFVRETLVEIVKGVKEAQEKTKASGALINPEGVITESNTKIVKWLPERRGSGDWREGQVVEFDVAVAVSEKDEAKGGIGIQVASIMIGVGVSGKIEDENSTISRLKFSVPLFLPEN